MTDRLADHHWRVEIPADAGRLAVVRSRLDTWLLELGVSEDDRYDLIIAVNEAVSNAVEHAYQDNDPGVVRIEGEVRPDGRVSVRVADDGRWRVPPVELSDRGRGLLLMRENVDEVHVERTPTGTSVTLVFAPRHAARGIPTHAPTDQVLVSAHDGWVEVVVVGDVPVRAGPAVRRRILTAARGGTVPIVVDLRGLGDRNEGLVRSLRAVAEAAAAADNRVVVRAPDEGSVLTALVAAGIDQVVDLVTHASPPTNRRRPPPVPPPPSRTR
ncbi:anti-sigma regulatory factor (Ser/Thr protein kinase) [Saccharothrix tamanrassetensis]|uniref:Anti-sigma regulatory factor (Ser/Thr protein kinase) n=1 Tax=Saccharothrix tamanrassetensis TaxID=1051531 RepID=A0A841CPN6_9PSEU|nr:ATP-binding protein [Saccharothrix tamanrassetensis]MBB5959259.1 anti-sigma regulatory factor (Ser/Thr protein kinase) [Saccharothrix tamanrassetensis]